MTDEQTDTTLKIRGLPKITEKEYLQYQYDTALRQMLKDPKEENVKNFEKANARLFEVQDLYRIGYRLLLERAKRLLAETLSKTYG